MHHAATFSRTVPPPPPPRPDSTSLSGVLRRLGSDSLYLLVSFPLGIATFVVIVTGLALGVGLAITLLGLPILAATLHLAGVTARVERVRIAGVLDVAIPDVAYRASPLGSGRVGQLWTVVTDSQRWSEAVHELVRFPVATVTWSLAITWWSLALAGLAYPVYALALPKGPDAVGLAELLGVHGRAWDIGLIVAIGLLATLTLPWIMRGLAITQASLGRALLFPAALTPARQAGR